MKKSILNTTAAMVVILAAFGSCGRGGVKATAEGAGETTKTAVADTMKIGVDAAKVDSVRVIFTGDEQLRHMDREDVERLISYAATSEYDTEWNDSGIMVKMVAPDYTVIFSYEGQSGDADDWMMIWREGGRVKFRQKWFHLANSHKERIYSLLDKYRN